MEGIKKHSNNRSRKIHNKNYQEHKRQGDHRSNYIQTQTKVKSNRIVLHRSERK